jgi:hypothetical protein
MLHWLEAGEHEFLNWVALIGAITPPGPTSATSASWGGSTWRPWSGGCREPLAFVDRDMKRINALGGYLHLVMSVPGLAAHVTHSERE